jgi:hypothetical protein
MQQALLRLELRLDGLAVGQGLGARQVLERIWTNRRSERDRHGSARGSRPSSAGTPADARSSARAPPRRSARTSPARCPRCRPGPNHAAHDARDLRAHAGEHLGDRTLVRHGGLWLAGRAAGRVYANVAALLRCRRNRLTIARARHYCVCRDTQPARHSWRHRNFSTNAWRIPSTSAVHLPEAGCAGPRGMSERPMLGRGARASDCCCCLLLCLLAALAPALASGAARRSRSTSPASGPTGR